MVLVHLLVVVSVDLTLLIWRKSVRVYAIWIVKETMLSWIRLNILPSSFFPATRDKMHSFLLVILVLLSSKQRRLIALVKNTFVNLRLAES